MKGMLIFASFLSVLIVGCKSGQVTGPAAFPESSFPTAELQGIFIHVDTTYHEQSTGHLIAHGRVTNPGNMDFSHPCFLEGTFYSDSSLQVELGTDRAHLGPLRSGSETHWRLYCYSPGVDLSQYPEFTVANFRVFTRTNQK